MMKSIAAVTVAAAVALSPLAALAQDKAAGGTDLQALRTAVKTDKRAYVASAMQLTPAEAKKFWPIYDAYQRRLDVLNTRRALLVENVVSRDGPMSDRYAKTVLNDWLTLDEDETKALRSLSRELQRALPARKAARYLQIESKIWAAQAYDIAAALPLVQ